MGRTLVFLLLLIISPVVIVLVQHATGQEIEWVKQIGEMQDRYGEVVGGVSLHGGHLYVIGIADHALPGQTYAGGRSDAFLRKYDLGGSEVWTREFGTNGSLRDFPRGVSATENGVFVAGTVPLGRFPSVGDTQFSCRSILCDTFVKKFDLNGNDVWTRQFAAGDNDGLNGIAADSTGVYVVGFTLGAFPGQEKTGVYDAFVRKYDNNGNELWTRQFGSKVPSPKEPLRLNGTVVGLAITVDRTGVYVVGEAAGLLLGQPSEEIDGAFIKSYDPNGNEMWTRQFMPGSQANSVTVDSSGIYIAGINTGLYSKTNGGSDAFVRKYDFDGKEMWADQFGGKLNDAAYGIYAYNGSVYVTGVILGVKEGTNETKWLPFVRSYNPEGSVVWTRELEVSSFAQGLGIAIDETGIYVTGQISGDFVGFSRAEAEQDAFVARLSLSPSPTVQSTTSSATPTQSSQTFVTATTTTQGLGQLQYIAAGAAIVVVAVGLIAVFLLRSRRRRGAT